MDKFGVFLLNEERSYLGHRIGDVLSSVQELQDDMPNLGSRHLARLAENVVNQIRKILHTNWNAKYNNKLKELQKIAVAIQKTIDEKGDLKEMIPSAVAALQNLSGKLGVKINNLEAPEVPDEQDIQPQDFQPTQEPQQADQQMNPDQQMVQQQQPPQV